MADGHDMRDTPQLMQYNSDIYIYLIPWMILTYFCLIFIKLIGDAAVISKYDFQTHYTE